MSPSITCRIVAFLSFFSVWNSGHRFLFPTGGSEVYGSLLKVFTGPTLAHNTYYWSEKSSLEKIHFIIIIIIISIIIIIISKLESQIIKIKYQ